MPKFKHPNRTEAKLVASGSKTATIRRLPNPTISLETLVEHVPKRTVGHKQIHDSLPVAMYATNADGLISHYNEAIVELLDHRPPIGEAWWRGSWKLYWPDGRPMSYDQC